jgi:uncharacterized protein (DUF362 family)/Pyruvate/2-oxoacid:ferredoxin oxidoreductase delta subunit
MEADPSVAGAPGGDLGSGGGGASGARAAASDATTPVRLTARPGPVSIARCAAYELDALRAAVREVLAPLGGIGAFVRPGERIGLKPNIILPSSADRAICTHPLLVAATALVVREAGAYPVVVESPGAGIVPLKSIMAGVFRRAGYREVADRYGFELGTDTDWDVVPHPDGRAVHRVELLSSALACDGLINLPKLKTHTFMVLSGATKNLFGLIPGLTKVGYHAKLAEPRRFGEMLVDVAALSRPRLNIVDAILAMEGQGPSTSGTPRHLGLLLAGADSIAVDVACCDILGIHTGAVPVLAAAQTRGLWSGRPGDTATVGVPMAEVTVKDFALPGKYLDKTGLGRAHFLASGPRSLLRDGFSRRPRPKAGRCTVCGACEQACPGGAIVMDKRAQVALVDDGRCIQCFCCHEVCPNAAIDLEFTGVGKVVHGLRLV